jgi:hypothetical protein
MFSPTEEQNDLIVNDLNVLERRLVMQFAQTLAQYGQIPKVSG